MDYLIFASSCSAKPAHYSHYSHHTTFAECSLSMAVWFNRAHRLLLKLLQSQRFYHVCITCREANVANINQKLFLFFISHKYEQWSIRTYAYINICVYVLCICKTSSSSIRYEMNHRFERQSSWRTNLMHPRASRAITAMLESDRYIQKTELSCYEMKHRFKRRCLWSA